MIVRTAIGLFIVLASLATCSKPADTAAPAPEPAAEPAPVVTKADTVIVDDGSGGTHMMGAMKFALGQGGEFTGVPGRSEPAGPVTIYVFRGIPPETAKFFSDSGVSIRENSAYLWPESAPYNADSIKQLKFVRAIDPALSDEALAAEFGVAAPAPPAAAGE